MVRMVTITSIIINNEVNAMSYQNINIQKKIASINAKKMIEQYSSIELIDLEDYDSCWSELFQYSLKKFRKIDSEPTFRKHIGNDSEDISWVENSLDFLKEKKEWFILVTNEPLPTWANVRVLNFTKAIEEFMTKQKEIDFIIADKSTGSIVQVFSEEREYEIHVGKCDISNIKNS